VSELCVAADVGPLLGRRTGVGVGVGGLLGALAESGRVELVRYVLSTRARLQPGMRRLPLPAAAAHRCWSRVSLPRVDRWLRPAELVHGTNYVVPPSRLPRVVTVHDCWFLAQPELASPTVNRAGAVLRRAVAEGAWVHAISTATARAARELLGTDRVVAVLNGPPPPLAPPRPPAWHGAVGGRPLIVAIGTIERRKNLVALVRAFGELDVPGQAPLLVLAGAPGDDTAAVRAAIDALPGPAREAVRLVGPVDEPAKSWLLQRAAALAYPSLDEGFGFPILEAQAAGTPLVASDAGAIPEVAGAGAELVPVGDVTALAAALSRVLADPDHRARLVAAGRANVTRFSWRSAAEQVLELYHRACTS
jgi:glycosyltransferase involved in cell wall biosynthesis